MKHFKLSLLAGSMGVTCVLLAGCTTSSTLHVPASSSSPSITPGHAEPATDWDLSLPYSVSTPVEAAEHATLVVRGAAGASHVEEIADTPFTVTTVDVAEVFKGQRTNSEVQVRQFGDEQNTSHEAAELLKAGSEYVLYLEPFELEAGKPLEQYVVVGSSAAYTEVRPGAYQVATPETALPETLTLDEIKASVKEAG